MRASPDEVVVDGGGRQKGGDRGAPLGPGLLGLVRQNDDLAVAFDCRFHVSAQLVQRLPQGVRATQIEVQAKGTVLQTADRLYSLQLLLYEDGRVQQDLALTPNTMTS